MSEYRDSIETLLTFRDLPASGGIGHIKNDREPIQMEILLLFQRVTEKALQE